MNWQDTVKAHALAALADRTVTADRIAAGAPWSWKADDVWLTRARQPRDLAARSSMSEQSTPTPQGSVLRI
jgi:hypothetical protein